MFDHDMPPPAADHACIYSTLLWATLDGLATGFEAMAEKNRQRAPWAGSWDERVRCRLNAKAFDEAHKLVAAYSRMCRDKIVEATEESAHVTN